MYLKKKHFFKVSFSAYSYSIFMEIIINTSTSCKLLICALVWLCWVTWHESHGGRHISWNVFPKKIVFTLPGNQQERHADSPSPLCVTTPCSSPASRRWASCRLPSGTASGRKMSSVPVTPQLPSVQSQWRSPDRTTTTAAPGISSHIPD